MTKEIIESLNEVKIPEKELHLAIGMFDGVHRGHQSVIEAAIHSAESEDGVSGVLTFTPHPSHLFVPDNPTQLIMSPKVKYNFLKNLGIDFVFQKHFDLEFAKIEAKDFVVYLKEQFPLLKAIYVGENFRFGHHRKGDVGLLVEIAKSVGVDVFSSDRINYNGEPISSTRIRKLLIGGLIEQANQLLGYHYFNVSKVIEGEKRGRQLGFPTLNMAWEAELKPLYGVYAVQVSSKQKSIKKLGVANFGMRPTFSDTDKPLLEVHLLGGREVDFGPNDILKVEWLSLVRKEKKFESVNDLLKQIGDDCTWVKNKFENLN